MRKILIICLIIAIGLGLSLLLYIINNKSNVTDISIEEFKPFTNSKYIKDLKIEYPKYKNNLPVIEAASAFYPLASGLVQNLYSKDSFNDSLLKMVSTNQAYEDIAMGNADVIIATEPSREQEKILNNSSYKINKVSLYKEPLVFYVNKTNKIDNLSIEEIREIYKNDNLNWKNFGSNKQTITTYQLEENNGSQTCASRIIGINIINRYHKQINTMPKIIDEVGNDKNGIGYAFNQYYSRMHINDNTKSIKVNGKNLADQDYPLQYDVYIFYNEETKNETLKAMVNYLKTNEGKSLIEELL